MPAVFSPIEPFDMMRAVLSELLVVFKPGSALESTLMARSLDEEAQARS